MHGVYGLHVRTCMHGVYGLHGMAQRLDRKEIDGHAEV
jgi:hypothetical protein